MQSDNRLLDDLAKLANGAAGNLHALKQEIEAGVKARVDRLASEMDLVSRDELEIVKEMAVKARQENEALKKKLDALEKKCSK